MGRRGRGGAVGNADHADLSRNRIEQRCRVPASRAKIRPTSVRRVHDGDKSLPAARVSARDGQVVWFLDQAAASLLPARSSA